jgi:hypothetical protein
VHRPERTSPLNVRVSDPERYDDNRGALQVRVRSYDGSSRDVPDAPEPDAPEPDAPEPERPTPEPEDEWDRDRDRAPEPPAPAVTTEQLQVDARSRDAVRTEQEYPAGTSLRVTASGMYFMRNARDWIVADAECAVSHRDHSWRPTGYEGDFAGHRSPLGDLVVNGAIVEWRPVSGRGSCDTERHTYTFDVTVSQAGPLRFVIADDYYDDNRGALDVRVEAR